MAVNQQEHRAERQRDDDDQGRGEHGRVATRRADDALAEVLRGFRAPRRMPRTRQPPRGAARATAAPQAGDAGRRAVAQRRKAYQGQYRNDQQKIQKDTK